MILKIKKIFINGLSHIYYFTIGRFIDVASLYKLNLQDYQILPCSINKEQYEFIVTDKYLPDLERHYREVKRKNDLAIQRFNNGNYMCFVYRDRINQEIAYTRWVSKNEFFSDELHMRLIFDKDEILTLDSYTTPTYRREHLHRDMNIEMLNWLKNQNEFHYVYMVIKCFIPYLKKYPKILGYKKIKTKIHYREGSLREFYKLIIYKIKRLFT